jgi:hypothetical protein
MKKGVLYNTKMLVVIASSFATSTDFMGVLSFICRLHDVHASTNATPRTIRSIAHYMSKMWTYDHRPKNLIQYVFFVHNIYKVTTFVRLNAIAINVVFREESESVVYSDLVIVIVIYSVFYVLIDMLKPHRRCLGHTAESLRQKYAHNQI